MLSSAHKIEIIELLARGCTLRFICKTHAYLNYIAIKHELENDPAFAAEFEAAKEDYADHLVSEIIDIADSSIYDVDDKNCRINARKWLASKLKEQYSDKSTESAGSKLKPEFTIITT